MKTKRASVIFTLLAMAILILDSGNTLNSASQGIWLCIQSVIPALFPFFVLSIYLTGNISSGTGWIPVLVCGFLGGYPVGAQAAASCLRNGSVTRADGNRLLMFCSQAGPSFLFGMVAQQFPEMKYAWVLWVIQLISALSVMLLVSYPYPEIIPSAEQPKITLQEAMQRSIRAIASVCGWVILFRVILGFLPIATNSVLISGLLELTNGCLALRTVESLSMRFFLAAIILNFGGICVILQTASVIRGLDLRYYLLGKVFQTAFAIMYTLAFLGHYWTLLPVFFIFLSVLLRNPAKNSSISRPVGV